MNTFSRFVASAAVPSVWCIDSPHLLRQETEKNSLNGRNAASSSQPRHGVIGAAILEAAGESTVTWPPLQREDQTQPVARAARTPKGDAAWQHVRASNSTFGARAVNYKQNVSSGAELQKKRSGPRRVPRNELDGEQSTDWIGGTWDKPLTHDENDSNSFTSDRCSHTDPNEVGPGFWFVKFADENLHYVSTVRLWNRDPDPNDRLNGACVRFSVDGTKPSSADADSDCDFKLSEIDSSFGPGSGTEIVIGRWIRGMMFLTQSGASPPNFQSVMTICGIWIIYEDTSATPPSTTTTTTSGEGDDTTPEQAGTIGVVIGVVVALAVVGAVLAVWSSGREGPTDAAPDAY